MTERDLFMEIKGHYHLAPKMLPLLWRPLHLGMVHVGEIFEGRRSFHLSSFRISSSLISNFFSTQCLVIFILVCPQRRENTVRCNLLFILVGHFGLLKNIDIAFFLLSPGSGRSEHDITWRTSWHTSVKSEE